MSQFIDLTDEVFGRWTVVGRHSVRSFRCGATRIVWACRCACDTERPVLGSNLRSGHSTSCGCAFLEAITTHGAARGYARTPEYGIWQSMRGRCRMPSTHRNYKRYGGRGISVCKRWDDFACFLADMGKRPSPKHSIERNDNDGNYEPGNCRWATNAEQQANKSTSRNNTSGVTGVNFNAASGHWNAWIKINRLSLFLGVFETKEQAAIAAVAARRVRDVMLRTPTPEAA